MEILESNWQAHLTLGFADDKGTTRLVQRSHVGPLRVQKPLYPEGEHICHAVVLHPPGGVVGGDHLALTTTVGSEAHAVLTTPGAAKWYKANGRISRQELTFTIGDDACLEWLPQESIFFDTADVQLTQTVNLSKTSRYIGCEILCFGRTASGESFTSGGLSQQTILRREGKLIWWEQGNLKGGSAAMHSPLGLSGNSVCATLLATGKPLSATVVQTIREDIDSMLGKLGNVEGDFGISQGKSLVVARYLGTSSEIARRVMLCVWQHVRPELMGCAAVVPRIWQT